MCQQIIFPKLTVKRSEVNYQDLNIRFSRIEKKNTDVKKRLQKNLTPGVPVLAQWFEKPT